MPLDLPTSNEDFTAFIKYNAKAGRWFVRGADGNEHEVQNPRFAMDLENVCTGWVNFPASGAPTCHWDVNNDALPRPPSPYGEKWKRGFKVMLFGVDPLSMLENKPLGLREWMSSALAANRGVQAAYTMFEASNAQNPDSVPVFRTNGIKVEHGPSGDSYEPVFELEKWVPRSALPALSEYHAKAQQSVQQPPQMSAAQYENASRGEALPQENREAVQGGGDLDDGGASPF